MSAWRDTVANARRVWSLRSSPPQAVAAVPQAKVSVMKLYVVRCDGQYATISGGWGPFEKAKFYIRKSDASARRNWKLNRFFPTPPEEVEIIPIEIAEPK